MTKKWMRVIACISIISIGLCIQIQTAAVGNFQLPAAGMGLLFEEGISMGDISTAYEVVPVELEMASVTTKTVDELLRTSEDGNAQENVEDFSNLVIAQVNNYVNVRSDAMENAEIVGKLYNNSVGEFLEEKNSWYKIKSGNVVGYVKKEFVVLGEEAELLVPNVGTMFATVNTQTLFIRGDNSFGAEIISMCPEAEELLVEAVLNDWIQVSVEAGDGYVASEYVTIHTEFVHAESKDEEDLRLDKEESDRLAAREAAERISAINAAAENVEVDTSEIDVVEGESEQTDIKAPKISTTGGDMGAAIVEYAMQFLGNAYVYGGTSLTNGADCSGFTQSLYKNYGVEIPRTSTAQRSVGTKIDGLENALPGDLICYSGHVALYTGNGNIIHASNSRTGIITGIADYRTIIAIRRIF